MKRTLIAGFILCLLVGVAFAGGRSLSSLAKDANSNAIQQFVPDYTLSRCDVITGTKAFKNISTAANIAIKYRTATSATDATPINIKVQYNSNTAYYPGNEGIIWLPQEITAVKFNKYSTATSTSVTICTERH